MALRMIFLQVSLFFFAVRHAYVRRMAGDEREGSAPPLLGGCSTCPAPQHGMSAGSRRRSRRCANGGLILSKSKNGGFKWDNMGV